MSHQLSIENQVSMLISNHDTELTRDWYQKALLYVVKALRTISRNTLRRGKVNKLLALYFGIKNAQNIDIQFLRG